MTMLPAEVHFIDEADAVTGTVDVENVVWKDGGWVGLLVDDGWVYYPPHAIGRIVSRKGDRDE